MSSSEEEYEVQEILEEKVEDGVVMYKIKWKDGVKEGQNWSDDANDEWKRHDEMNCPALMEAFKQKQKRANDRIHRSGSRKRNHSMKNKDCDAPKRKRRKAFIDSDEDDEDRESQHPPSSSSTRTDSDNPPISTNSNVLFDANLVIKEEIESPKKKSEPRSAITNSSIVAKVKLDKGRKAQKELDKKLEKRKKRKRHNIPPAPLPLLDNSSMDGPSLFAMKWEQGHGTVDRPVGVLERIVHLPFTNLDEAQQRQLSVPNDLFVIKKEEPSYEELIIQESPIKDGNNTGVVENRQTTSATPCDESEDSSEDSESEKSGGDEENDEGEEQKKEKMGDREVREYEENDCGELRIDEDVEMIGSGEEENEDGEGEEEVQEVRDNNEEWKYTIDVIPNENIRNGYELGHEGRIDGHATFRTEDGEDQLYIRVVFEDLECGHQFIHVEDVKMHDIYGFRMYLASLDQEDEENV